MRRIPGLTRLGVLAIAGVTIVAVANPAAAQSALHVVDLGTLGPPCCSTATAINDRGDVVGYSAVGGPVPASHAFLWRAGQMADLGTLGGNSSVATDINNRGDVVGHAATAGGTTHAFLWHAGQMVDLGTLGGDSSVAMAVNDRGEITGFSVTAAFELRAFLWRDGVMSDLGTVNGGFARAADINNRGDVVGDSSVDGMNSVPLLWRRGVLTRLSERFGAATAVNDRGQVTGIYFDGTGSFLWSAGRVTDLATLPGATFTQATGINNRGQIVGYAGVDAFLWQRRRMTALPRLSTGAATAQDINDRGQIAGDSSTNPNGGDSHAVIWTR